MYRIKPSRFILKLFLLVLIMGSLELTPAFSQHKYTLDALLRCSREQAILHAFERLVGSSGEASLDVIVEKPVRVIFKDLGQLNPQMKHYDAISWISVEGQQLIFIHEKHRGAPVEALAALIAHEALHDDTHNSLHEEIAGWEKERQVWQEMKQQSPHLASIPPGQSPLVDRLNRIEEEAQTGSLSSFIRNNPGYRGLPEHSPGF